MKKLILKIISVIAAFFLGILFMGYRMTAGNDNLMDSMAGATLPLVTFVVDGQEYNTMHGYVGEMDGASIRGDVIPLPEDRTLSLVVDPYETTVKHVYYEVRTLDHRRLIEDAEVGFFMNNHRLEARLSLKDLLDEGEEYALIIQLEDDFGKVISYYGRIAHIGETKLSESLDFARIWHDATFDKENTVSITKYLESDATADNETLEEVTIHSRYKQIIWDQMAVQPYSEVAVHVTELETDITSLRLDFVVQYENDEKQTEYYEVQEYFRIRHTDQRIYLLDYYRTANRVFDPEVSAFRTTQLELGILDAPVHYMKNEEENIVAFVQNGELWSYDHARNTLSYVMGFRDGWDPRSNYSEHDMKIMSIDESGSMHFLVYGYMNRGIHEGITGIGVYRYDALANTVEELAFLQSPKPYAVLKEDLGELAHVTGEEMLYLYLDGNICSVDLTTRAVSWVTRNLPEDSYLLSEDQSMMAWQAGQTLPDAKKIQLLNLNTGKNQVIEAGPGEYVRSLGFMGTDFIWGTAAAGDIQVDMLGNVVFPMHKISIQSAQGETIREFSYGEQGKYVVSVSMEDNRISMECVAKASDGSYVETTPEPITNKVEEVKEKIQLKTKTTNSKKREYVFGFANQRDEEMPTRLTPKQVLFEESRTLKLLQETEQECYYVYGRGGLAGSYGAARDAILAADALMGVVTDSNQQVIWNRGGRKTKTQISGLEGQVLAQSENGLERSLMAILQFESHSSDVKQELLEGKNALEILEGALNENVMNLTGCDISSVLYYVSEGKPVLALTEPGDAVVIAGYDQQNTILLDPQTGKLYKKGMNDSREFFAAYGNRFAAYLEMEE